MHELGHTTSERTLESEPRHGRTLRWLLRAPVARAPVAPYSAHTGWLLGHRFLLLTHRGRRTHRLHRTVLEVVAWRRHEREAVVVSGLGRRSQWYKNVLAGEAVEVQIGRLRFPFRARPVGLEEATRVIADYERRRRIPAPLVRALLSQLAGFRYDGLGRRLAAVGRDAAAGGVSPPKRAFARRALGRDRGA